MNQDRETVAQLEAVLFSEGGEMSLSAVYGALSITSQELGALVHEYNEQQRGTVLVLDGAVVVMRVAGEYASLIEEMRKEEQGQDLSKAALEVLSIVLYSESSSMSASELEQVRGVNSGYTLRQLTVRGLLGKVRKGAEYRYTPSVELLSFLGVTVSSDLPEHEQVQQRIQEFKENHAKN